jgi:hypothetical protein
LWNIPEVRETSKDAIKNFALNNMGFPMRHVVVFLLYALLVVVLSNQYLCVQDFLVLLFLCAVGLYAVRMF